MRPLLSICVPTYNRLPYLEPLLNSIATQWEEGVELCFSDNASTDGTAEWLEAQQAEFAWLRWEGRGTNVGADRNFLFAAGMAEGEYVWIMGSDDALAPGAIGRVLRSLRERRPDVMVTGFTVCDPELHPRHPYDGWAGIPEERELAGDPREVVASLMSCAQHLGSILTYLSNTITRAVTWQETTVWLPSVGSGYPQLALILDSLPVRTRLLIDARPAVLYRQGNDSFASQGVMRRQRLDVESLRKIFGRAFPEAPEISRDLEWLLRHDHYPDRLSYYLAYRSALGNAEWREYANWLKTTFGPRWQLTVADLTPKAALSAVRNLKRRLRPGSA